MRSRLPPLLMLIAVSSAGCTAITSTEQFREVDLRLEFDRMNSGCGACMASRCASYAPCARSATCIDYAECRFADQSPAGYAACGNSSADFERLLNCEECTDACRLGRNWACKDNYLWPAVVAPIHFQQRLLDNQTVGDSVLSNVDVKICGRDVACASGEALNGTTDAEGWVDLELPNGKEGVGFDGYLLLSGAQIPTMRVHRSIPLGSGELETELFTTQSLLRIVSGSTVGLELPPIDFSRPHAVFQVLDCFHQPALGVDVRLYEDPDPDQLTLYNDDSHGKGVNFEGTTRLGRGTGAILNLTRADEPRRIEFRQGGEVLGHAVITVNPGDITVAVLEPNHAR